MSNRTSHYPISKVIAKIIMNSGYTPLGYLLARRDSSAEAGLPDLESWLEKGEGDESTIAQITSFEPGEAEKLHKAVAETVAMKAAGVDPVAFERETREQEKIDRFRPYVHAEGEDRIPNGITIFGLTGEHARWTTIRIPTAILKLPLEEQLAKLPGLMAEFKQQNNGLCPFFGKLVGFKFVRWNDYFQFDADGQLLERVEEQFRHGEAWAELQ